MQFEETKENVRIKNIPEKFGWIVVLKKLKERGYYFKFIFNIDGKRIESRKLDQWVFDEEYKGFEPVVPEEIQVFKRNSYGKEFLVMTIRNRRGFLDPNPDETISIFELTRNI